jgi:diguanylate cyclase (GGDEF)-like protein
MLTVTRGPADHVVMRRLPSAIAPEPSSPRSGWVLHPYPRLLAHDRAREETSAFAFAARMLVAVTLTLLVVGASGYLLLDGTSAGRSLIALAALAGGAAVFYLAGGRRLMRDYRTALRRATRDGLTDLPNRRAFEDEFPDALASASRYRDPLALVVLDLDEFKLINDRHGSREGDSVLRVLSGILRSSRPGDRPYRIGGDDFALLLTHTDDEGARTVVRRLSRDFAEACIAISIGASVLRPGLTPDTLRAEAGTALYEAKRRGGQRAVHFEEIRSQVTPERSPSAIGVLADGG